VKAKGSNNNLGRPTEVGLPFLLPGACLKNLRTQVFYRAQAQAARSARRL